MRRRVLRCHAVTDLQAHRAKGRQHEHGAGLLPLWRRAGGQGSHMRAAQQPGSEGFPLVGSAAWPRPCIFSGSSRSNSAVCKTIQQSTDCFRQKGLAVPLGATVLANQKSHTGTKNGTSHTNAMQATVPSMQCTGARSGCIPLEAWRLSQGLL
eukprot:jgi/Ulvmu1/7690/UM038_0122.1